MRTEEARPVRLADYRASDYLIDRVELDFSLHVSATRVLARLHMRPNPKGAAGAPLVLDGDGINAVRADLDGRAIDLRAAASPDRLTIAAPPRGAFVLSVETLVDPAGNTQLSGLYRSGSAYCTQCEAEGFRRITYFLDRPDVLSVYTTRIEAEKSEAPVLLGNGNPGASGDIAGTSRHFALWHDPHPKPCYLFALVGGDLASIHDTFQTMSGADVKLGIYTERGREARAAYAMDALKRSMAWDETAFGRQYDLDVFNIVAVSDFNMGAMENKGLNVFNDKYVLASPRTATDTDYALIESVIAHEYFHNWTGNRITCRDWFQLCLKEGLTVFRDREFSADQRSRAVRRIADVRALRAAQFVEDAGPLAHNVRPGEYLEINNFYTPTIYEKGAEIVRMLKTLIGADAFRKGMDLYFARFDGTAAVVEDFISCFAEVSGRDLSQFMLWYNQAGTPLLRAACAYDADARALTLDLSQSCAPTPGQPDKQPLVIPVALGLTGADGDLALETPAPGEPGGAGPDEIQRGVFELAGSSRRILFRNVAARPALSLLRGFSAPVNTDFEIDEAGLLVLLEHDTDLFNRWQAAQTLAARAIVRSVDSIRGGGQPRSCGGLAHALGEILAAHASDMAFAALAITMPGEADIAREIGADIDPDAIHAARQALRREIGAALAKPILETYHRLAAPAGPYSPDAKSAGRRALRNALLDLGAAGKPEEGAALAFAQFSAADNMTDKFAALSVLAQSGGARREEAFAAFLREFEDDALVVDKWFALQASITDGDTLARVRALMAHPLFTAANPNRLRSLIGSFCANPPRFHAAGGGGYDLLAEVVTALDPQNPQVAARLLGALRTWRTLEPGRRAKAEAALRRVAARAGLSPDTRDIAGRSLG